jgi:hypothetical protein
MWYVRCRYKIDRSNRSFNIFVNVFIISFLSVTLLSAQPKKSDTNETLDFSAVEAYFRLTDNMRQNITPTGQEWAAFFEAPINKLMVSAGALDTTKFKNDLSNVYLTTNTSWEHIDDKGLQHHYKYRRYENELRQHIDFLKSSNVFDSILKYVSPYLPLRLRHKENIPRQYYIFYGSEDATGGGDMVINDLLLSYKIDTYYLGLLSAHETFHSIVSKAFGDLILTSSSGNDPTIGLLYFLSNISQEGVADLIDKSLLMKPQSPLKTETDQLFEDERALATKYINGLDSLLKNSKGNFNVAFPTLFENFSKHGGHIPGRLMGMTINNCDLLPELLSRIEDPVAFIELYNKAVEECKLSLPLFSEESLAYLNKLRTHYFKKLKG